MGSSPVTHHNAPARNPVPEGKTRICVAGCKVCDHAGRARRLADFIARKYPNEYETWFYFDSAKFFDYFNYETFGKVPFPEHLKGHSTSPFCWLEKGNNNIDPIGGRSHLAEWAEKTFPNDKDIIECAKSSWTFGDVFHAFGSEIQPTAK